MKNTTKLGIVSFLLAVVFGSVVLGYLYNDQDSFSLVWEPTDKTPPYTTGGDGLVPEPERFEPDEDVSLMLRQLIIKTGTLVLEVFDYDETYSNIINLTRSYEGYISSYNMYTVKISGEKVKKGIFVIRLPSDYFESAMETFRDLGEVSTEDVTTRDVTEEYVDLDSRLRNLQAQEEQYLALLEKAWEIEDILLIQKELERVRGEIERLLGRMKYLEDQATLSTIRIEYNEKEPEPNLWDQLGLDKAWEIGIATFVIFIRGFVIFLVGWSIPIIVIILIVSTIWRKRDRRFRGQRREQENLDTK